MYLCVAIIYVCDEPYGQVQKNKNGYLKITYGFWALDDLKKLQSSDNCNRPWKGLVSAWEESF